MTEAKLHTNDDCVCEDFSQNQIDTDLDTVVTLIWKNAFIPRHLKWLSTCRIYDKGPPVSSIDDLFIGISKSGKHAQIHLHLLLHFQVVTF